MPASLAFGKRSATAYSATTSQAGYGPDNLGLESLARPWRSADTTAQDVVLTFAAAAPLHTLHLHDVNFAAADVYKSVDGVAYNLVGALSAYQGKEGRRRGAIVINDATVKAVKISIANGAATDGLAYKRIGAAYAFSSVAIVGAPFQFPYAARFLYPQVRSQLPNGQTPAASTGMGFHLVEVPWRPFDNEDLEPVVRRARAATVLLNLGMANYPAQLWPVRLEEDQMEESFSAPRTSDLKLIFREVA